jgi:SP family xylose:H+ symportor-like MFS transporter
MKPWRPPFVRQPKPFFQDRKQWGFIPGAIPRLTDSNPQPNTNDFMNIPASSASSSNPDYKPAGSVSFIILVTFVAAMGGLLFGYDTAVISGAIGFMEKFFQLSPAQTGWAASCVLVGCVVGAGFAGMLCDRLGRKATLLVAAALFLISSIGTAIPVSLSFFVVFRIIGGLGVGVASMASPMYIAEITPARIRGRMVSLNQFAIIGGMLVVYFVNYLIAKYGGGEAWNVHTGWRMMFLSGAVPSGLMLLFTLCVPETPRFLVSQGHREKAMEVLVKVDGSDYAKLELAEITSAMSHEEGNIRELLKPGLKLALFVGIGLSILQQVTGINVILYYAPEIFKAIGNTSSDTALLQTIVVGAVNLIFTVVAIWKVDGFGRRPLMIIGYAGMGLFTFGQAYCFYTQTQGLGVLLCMLGYIAFFALSAGPITWVLLAEIYPNKVRGRAMAIACAAQWISNYVVSQTFPMMNKNEFLAAHFHKAFPYWIYGSFCAVAVLFVMKFVPETKGKSLEEIERIWTRE